MKKMKLSEKQDKPFSIGLWVDPKTGKAKKGKPKKPKFKGGKWIKLNANL